MLLFSVPLNTAIILWYAIFFYQVANYDSLGHSICTKVQNLQITLAKGIQYSLLKEDRNGYTRFSQAARFAVPTNCSLQYVIYPAYRLPLYVNSIFKFSLTIRTLYPLTTSLPEFIGHDECSSS